jgi:hypothetical protein
MFSDPGHAPAFDGGQSARQSIIQRLAPPASSSSGGSWYRSWGSGFHGFGS